MRRVLNLTRWLILLAPLFSGACTCSPTAASLEGLACDAERCVGGFVCDTGTETCIAIEICDDSDGDGYCAESDCDNSSADCTVDCVDADGDGIPLCAGDCDDGNAHCGFSCDDVDGDDWCPPFDCDDANEHCDQDCTDGDSDGWCVDHDCDDTQPGCTNDCVASSDGDAVPDCLDDCLDFDHDGFGNGNLDNVGCAVSTATDRDDTNGSICGDTDADNCEDCSSGTFDPSADGADGDDDGTCDLSDTCTDGDGDLVGSGTLGNVGCTETTLTDSDDGDPLLCLDTDGDGCDDCSQGSGFNPALDGTDDDQDGFCATNDGDDGNEFWCDVDTDTDDCDDCARGYYNPANDGDDLDGDGLCSDYGVDCNDLEPTCAETCEDLDSDGIDDCADDCIDDDGDGYGEPGGNGTCLGTDCDEVLTTCNADCSTNSDGDSETDCREVACGSDPDNSVDDCLMITSAGEFSTAIGTANGTDHRDKLFVLQDISGIGDHTISSTSGACIELRGIGSLTFSNDRFLTVQDDGCVFDGVHIIDGREVLTLEGDNTVVRDSIFEDVERIAIRVEGANTRILNSFFDNVSDGCDTGRAAVSIRSTATKTLVAGNVIDTTACKGIYVAGSSGTTVGYNTIVDAAQDGIYIGSTAPTDLCVEYNIISSSGEAAFQATMNIDGAFASGCDADLGNIEHASTDCDCPGSGCSCTPTNFWAATDFDPLFDANLCPEDDTLIIDGSTERSYHTSGDLSFVDPQPDIGGRETGSPECPVIP